MGELGRAKIAIQRLLYIDDEYVLAHAAEVVEVNNFFFVAGIVILQFFAFVTFLYTFMANI